MSDLTGQQLVFHRRTRGEAPRVRLEGAAAPPPRGFAQLVARGGSVIARLRDAPLLRRVAVAVLAFAALAFVGRSPLAEGRTVPSAAPSSVATPALAAAPAASAEPAPSSTPIVVTAAAPSRRATPDDPVYLNVASREDLRRLPGIGDKRAEAILALRQKLGRFRQVEDLARVKGIGRATLRKLRPLVRLDAPATAQSADAGAPAR